MEYLVPEVHLGGLAPGGRVGVDVHRRRCGEKAAATRRAGGRRLRLGRRGQAHPDGPRGLGIPQSDYPFFLLPIHFFSLFDLCPGTLVRPNLNLQCRCRSGGAPFLF